MIKFVLVNLKSHILMHIIYMIKFLHGPMHLVVITLGIQFQVKNIESNSFSGQKSGC
jgi:hypothetical protein